MIPLRRQHHRLRRRRSGVQGPRASKLQSEIATGPKETAANEELGDLEAEQVLQLQNDTGLCSNIITSSPVGPPRRQSLDPSKASQFLDLNDEEWYKVTDMSEQRHHLLLRHQRIQLARTLPPRRLAPVLQAFNRGHRGNTSPTAYPQPANAEKNPTT